MIIINNAVLHILDFNSNAMVFSDLPLEIHNEAVETFIIKHLEKSINNTGAFESQFSAHSEMQKTFTNYAAGDIDFISFSTAFAKQIQAALSESDKTGLIDVLAVDFSLDNEKYFGALLCENKVGFTHQVIQTNEGLRNEIINHYAILPNISQKIDTFALVNLSTLAIQYADKKYLINGEDTYLLRDAVLKIDTGVSQKETFKLVNEVTKKVSDEYGGNSAQAVSKVKKIIRDNSETSEYINPLDIGAEIFEESELMQEKYKQEMIAAKAPESVKVKNNFVERIAKKHKIKTDTGVEISIPIDYFEDRDFIEFINNANGTLSIEIKNIGKIVNS